MLWEVLCAEKLLTVSLFLYDFRVTAMLLPASVNIIMANTIKLANQYLETVNSPRIWKLIFGRHPGRR